MVLLCYVVTSARQLSNPKCRISIEAEFSWLQRCDVEFSTGGTPGELGTFEVTVRLTLAYPLFFFVRLTYICW